MFLLLKGEAFCLYRASVAFPRCSSDDTLHCRDALPPLVYRARLRYVIDLLGRTFAAYGGHPPALFFLGFAEAEISPESRFTCISRKAHSVDLELQGSPSNSTLHKREESRQRFSLY